MTTVALACWNSEMVRLGIVLTAGFAAGLAAGFLLGRQWGGRPRKAPAAGGAAPDARGPRSRKKATSSDLYIGNLPYGLGDEDVTNLLKAYGRVVSLRIIADRSTGSSRGYGFATMGSPEEVDAAIQGLHNREIEGRRMVVNEAKSRPRDRRD